LFINFVLLYQEILEAKRQRHLKKTELGKRRSAASQNRMRIISSLGAEATVKKGKRNKEDTFGMDDEDWNVYRAIVSIENSCLYVVTWATRELASEYVQ